MNDFYPKSNADIIMAGTQSCLLAIDTINELSKFDDPTPQAMVAAARGVLKYWGMAAEKVDVPPVAPAVASAPDEFPWPPPEPTLPAIYTENFYIVRDLEDQPWMLKVDVEQTMYHSTRLEHQLVAGQQLSFTGRSQWNPNESSWRMLMHDALLGPGGSNVWVSSKALKPGDEIPKVIDASKMAGNTDP